MSNTPSVYTDPANSRAISRFRIGIGITGLVAVVVGLLILIWPQKVAEVIVLIVAIYALIAGIIYVGLGIAAKHAGTWRRVGSIVLGLIFIAVGIIAIVNLTAATVFMATFLGILVGVTWIVEGIVALMHLGDSRSRIWSIVFAVISIIAGAILLFSPLFVAVLWLWLGISLIVLGIIQAVRAFTFGKQL